MGLLLALECSTVEGSLALVEEKQNDFTCLYLKKWRHKVRLPQKSHSDRLPLEIDQALKQTGKNLSDLQSLCVGAGPGRWTGVRTALSVIRSLSFALQIPSYSVNSLRISAEPFLLSPSQTVFTAFNGFKNQVYCAEFSGEGEGKPRLLHFPDWCKYMENKAQSGKAPVCVSDLEDFYSLPENLKSAFSFKKADPHALSLAKIVCREGESRLKQNWSDLKAFYLRSPLE